MKKDFISDRTNTYTAIAERGIILPCAFVVLSLLEEEYKL